MAQRQLTIADAKVLNDINRLNKDIKGKAKTLRIELEAVIEAIDQEMQVMGFEASRTQKMAELDIDVIRRRDLYLLCNYMGLNAEEIDPDAYYQAGRLYPEEG